MPDAAVKSLIVCVHELPKISARDADVPAEEASDTESAIPRKITPQKAGSVDENPLRYHRSNAGPAKSLAKCFSGEIIKQLFLFLLVCLEGFSVYEFCRNSTYRLCKGRPSVFGV